MYIVQPAGISVYLNVYVEINKQFVFLCTYLSPLDYNLLARLLLFGQTTTFWSEYIINSYL